MVVGKKIFSGIQPTGKIHLGNFLGAIKHWVGLQDDNNCLFCLANSHSITVDISPKVLQEQTYELACMLLACGIDPKKSNIFIQSQNDFHQALAWILDCNIPMGEMERMTQFKDKAGKNPKNINVGLFNYPALMASDILLYESEFVPVGADQKQHLELSRNVAQRFNTKYGEVFVVPEPLICDSGARIMGLDDPECKMSKSHNGANHALFLTDSNDQIAKKIKKATTDSLGVVAFDASRNGIYNLLGIYKELSGKGNEEIESEFCGKGYGEFKNALIDLLVQTIEPIRDRYVGFMSERGYVDEILSVGREHSIHRAQQIYSKAKELVGLL